MRIEVTWIEGEEWIGAINLSPGEMPFLLPNKRPPIKRLGKALCLLDKCAFLLFTIWMV